ncbi:hypothetical protein [Desulfovibrio sp.]|uniref:coiled-coil domain-containing protein n=1 Tax=Desulfovibrio sp. TaxID=885 RepID=UPI002A91B8F6|nr:hypothetical protein [Desulfovibrio sp.]MDY5429620.1 hypothetical protein [Desulfovibrio sp.]MDY6234751.1 hypothetical protein [Desulfovibrio sp.]
MSKFLDHMFSPSLGWPMLYIGVILLLSTPIVRIQKYLMSLGIFIFPMSQGLLFIFMSLPILYLSNKNKTLHKKNQYKVKNRDTLSTDIFDKEAELISLKKEIDKAGRELKDIRAEVARDKAKYEQARQEKAALQAELEKTRAELEQARQGEGQGLKWYGLIAVVEQCRKEGKTPQETAACLKGAGASWAMIGGLLHPRGELKDWQQYGKDLFNGSTKTLPW